MKTLDVSADDVEPPDWLPDLPRVAAFVLNAISVSDYEIGVLLCSDSRIADLNAQYRGNDGPTDVLSFSQNEGDAIPVGIAPAVAGDIVISLDSVRANAERFGVSAAEETVRAVVHGILHLAGYQHEGVSMSDDGAGEHPMLGLQENIVSALIKELNE